MSAQAKARRAETPWLSGVQRRAADQLFEIASDALSDRLSYFDEVRVLIVIPTAPLLQAQLKMRLSNHGLACTAIEIVACDSDLREKFSSFTASITQRTKALHVLLIDQSDALERDQIWHRYLESLSDDMTDLLSNHNVIQLLVSTTSGELVLADTTRREVVLQSAMPLRPSAFPMHTVGTYIARDSNMGQFDTHSADSYSPERGFTRTSGSAFDKFVSYMYERDSLSEFGRDDMLLIDYIGSALMLWLVTERDEVAARKEVEWDISKRKRREELCNTIQTLGRSRAIADSDAITNGNRSVSVFIKMFNDLTTPLVKIGVLRWLEFRLIEAGYKGEWKVLRDYVGGNLDYRTGSRDLCELEKVLKYVLTLRMVDEVDPLNEPNECMSFYTNTDEILTMLTNGQQVSNSVLIRLSGDGNANFSAVLLKSLREMYTKMPAFVVLDSGASLNAHISDGDSSAIYGGNLPAIVVVRHTDTIAGVSFPESLARVDLRLISGGAFDLERELRCLPTYLEYERVGKIVRDSRDEPVLDEDGQICEFNYVEGYFYTFFDDHSSSHTQIVCQSREEVFNAIVSSPSPRILYRSQYPIPRVVCSTTAMTVGGVEQMSPRSMPVNFTARTNVLRLTGISQIGKSGAYLCWLQLLCAEASLVTITAVRQTAKLNCHSIDLPYFKDVQDAWNDYRDTAPIKDAKYHRTVLARRQQLWDVCRGDKKEFIRRITLASMGSDNPFGECLTNERILRRLQNCSTKDAFLNYDRRLTRVDHLFDEQQHDHNHWPAMEKATNNSTESGSQRSQVHADTVRRRKWDLHPCMSAQGDMGLPKQLDCYISQSVEAAYFVVSEAELHIRLKSRSMKRTVFIPTHRPEKRLALDHGLVDRLQILVVPGGAWTAAPEAYFPHLINGWMLLIMPNTIDLDFLPADHLLRNCFTGGKRPSAEYGKIGYSRLFIQLFAHAVGLSEVWVLDDNITKCERRNIVESAGSEKSWQVGPGSIERVDLEEFMQQAERVFEPENAVTAPATCMRRARPSGSRLESVSLRTIEEDEETPRYIKEMCGPKECYGLIAPHRGGWQPSIPYRHLFSIKFTAYSFMLLNVKATVGRHLYYPSKSPWQDLDFNQLLLDNGLAVCKFMQYCHTKKDLQAPRRARMVPAIGSDGTLRTTSASAAPMDDFTPVDQSETRQILESMHRVSPVAEVYWKPDVLYSRANVQSSIAACSLQYQAMCQFLSERINGQADQVFRPHLYPSKEDSRLDYELTGLHSHHGDALNDETYSEIQAIFFWRPLTKIYRETVHKLLLRAISKPDTPVWLLFWAWYPLMLGLHDLNQNDCVCRKFSEYGLAVREIYVDCPVGVSSGVRSSAEDTGIPTQHSFVLLKMERPRVRDHGEYECTHTAYRKRALTQGTPPQYAAKKHRE